MIRLTMIGALALLVVVTWSALAAANTVPASSAGETTASVDPFNLRPAECAGMPLTDLVTGDITVHGSDANDLIFGGSGNDNIDGKNGDDCLVGSSGNDVITGNNGNDIILGGPGNDIIDGKNGYDICYGGPGTDTFMGCEVVYQN
jgi:Ca2+-binding RTX toxin-like protein